MGDVFFQFQQQFVLFSRPDFLVLEFELFLRDLKFFIRRFVVEFFFAQFFFTEFFFPFEF